MIRNYQKELEKKLVQLEKTGSVPTLLLHSCCAPCSSYVLEYLSEYFSITVFYYNPNIFPEEEFIKRIQEQDMLIQKLPVKHEIKLIAGNYDSERFYEMAKGLEQVPEGGERCFKCYELRLRETAELAKARGYRPVVAEVDEMKLSLAITNLVENAIKYNKENGWVHVDLNADHKYFYLKVTDSGIGIPPEETEHIFERFYRVDKSHSREIGGTGLGLAIARNAVILHRGAIKVHSELGEGTTFNVRIPLNYIAK